jgi:hypothetical protein
MNVVAELIDFGESIVREGHLRVFIHHFKKGRRLARLRRTKLHLLYSVKEMMEV